jgi:proline iminopeptidase
MKKVILILVSLLLLCFQPLRSQDYYFWYGKRFDWLLDRYGKNPSHPDSVQLFIREIGRGDETYLVIHGGFGAEHSYLLDALLPVANKVRLIFYDQRGSLRSPAPDSVITIDGHIKDIERIRKAYQLQRVNIIAHSMGTFLAMKYLATYPAHTGKMILISSVPAKLSESNLKEQDEYQKNHFAKMYAEQPALWDKELTKKGFKGRFSMAQIGQRDFMYMQQFWSASGTVTSNANWEKDNRGSTFLVNSHSGSLAYSQMPQSYDFTDALRNHPYEIIFVKGMGDFLSPAVLQNSIAGIKNCRVYLVENAGHNIWIEEPRTFDEIMLSVIQ